MEPRRQDIHPAAETAHERVAPLRTPDARMGPAARGREWFADAFRGIVVALREAPAELVGGCLAARDLWRLSATIRRRARQAELDVDARSRELAPPGERFARWSARYWDPMASQVRHADRLDRRTYGGQVAVGWSPSTVDRWTRARWLGGSLLYPWWVGWLPTLRLRQRARALVALRFPWCRPTDFGPPGLVVEWSTVGLDTVDTV